MKYFDMIKEAMDTIDKSALELAFEIQDRYEDEYCPSVFLGNGGSAAIANHIVADFTKGISEDCANTTFPAISLCSNAPLITAIANDLGYENIFSRQLEYLNLPKADVVGISSSGNSPNIINGFYKANSKQYNTIALVGFDGGRILKEKMADVIIHVKSDNYGVVEDCHMMILHAFAQKLRMKHADDPSRVKL